MQTTPGEVTRLLEEIRNGRAEAGNELVPLLYRELRRIAASIMKNERVGHTLEPTAVVHEAYLKLVGGPTLVPENRSHFLGVAARAMRQVLVDHARHRQAGKRGGEGQERVQMDEQIALTPKESTEILALHEALERLAKVDPRQAEIIQMQYFTGSSVEEIADAFGIGIRTAKRELQTGRLFLKEQLAPNGVALR